MTMMPAPVCSFFMFIPMITLSWRVILPNGVRPHFFSFVRPHSLPQPLVTGEYELRMSVCACALMVAVTAL